MCSDWKRTLATGLARLEASCNAAVLEGLEFDDFDLRTLRKRLLMVPKLADFDPCELDGSSTKWAL